MTLKYTSIGLGISAGMYTQNIEGENSQKKFVWKGKIEFKHSSILCIDFEEGVYLELWKCQIYYRPKKCC